MQDISGKWLRKTDGSLLFSGICGQRLSRRDIRRRSFHVGLRAATTGKARLTAWRAALPDGYCRQNEEIIVHCTEIINWTPCTIQHILHQQSICRYSIIKKAF